ncbi:cytochrome P450 [Candidatus Blastococcus massiliensis]|uniref:cytochrome P450 n=1 Tax=Candidatus Blastococcus massiliensis TaxID=1470358 RepID=UPI0004B66A47|nr:cytochrome P450 [Candidatus Blastococcus massiliensis]
MTVDDRFTEEARQERLAQVQLGTVNEIVSGPVSDWTTDFSHFEEEYAENAIEVWDDLRGRCPVARTERFGGAWLPTRYEDVAAIAYDTEHFTSRAIIVSNVRPPLDLAPVGVAPPISSDPPFHHDARKLLLPAFTKTNVAKQEITTRAFCHSLIDGFAGRDVVDAATDYGMYIPMRVIADMLGFPQEDTEKFVRFVENALEGANGPIEERQERGMALSDYLFEQVRDHLDDPRDDLTTYLINAELYGQRLSPQHVVGTMTLLLIAGIDTTWSAIGASLWHLAKNPQDRKRLVEDPSLRPKAVEEFLRAYAPVTMARLVKEDVELGGVQMKKEDWVLLPFPAANRDPERFERADEVIIDREVNRHAAFGLGIHRCVGSHLARMELTVALDVWLDRIPEFSLADPDAVRWSAGQIRGPRALPMRIG